MGRQNVMKLGMGIDIKPSALNVMFIIYVTWTEN